MKSAINYFIMMSYKNNCFAFRLLLKQKVPLKAGLECKIYMEL